jgi:coenzyme F420-dependent glucose-6-phosphate dehydrogenase
MTKFYWFLGHEQFQPEVLVEYARKAEAAGFDGLAVSEHFHPWVDDAGAGGFAWATLGAIAGATERVNLLTTVVTPLWRYHPAVVAQAAATVDRLSGGRFALGVGTGENLNEGPLGYEFPAYAERAERMREALHVIDRLLGGAKLDYDGKYYKTKGARLYSPPMSRVPVYMAASGPKSAAIAGGQTDGVIVSVKDPDEALDKVVTPAREASEGGTPVVVAQHWSVRGANDAEAWRALAAWRGLRAPSRATATDPATLRREADELPRDEVLARYSRVDTAEDYIRVYSEVAKRVRPDILVINTTSTNQTETIAMVGGEVLPELRRIMKEREKK